MFLEVDLFYLLCPFEQRYRLCLRGYQDCARALRKVAGAVSTFVSPLPPIVEFQDHVRVFCNAFKIYQFAVGSGVLALKKLEGSVVIHNNHRQGVGLRLLKRRNAACVIVGK